MDNLDFNYFCKSCPQSEEYRRANCFTTYKIREYKAGEYIAYKGATAKELTVLVKGGVETSIILDSGISYTSRYHTAPYAFGALAIFANQNKYRADIMATERCDTISVSREMIEDQMVQCKTFLRNFIAYNMSKLDLFQSHLSVLTHKNLKSRLAFYILSISESGEFKFDKSLEELSVYLCVERPSLSRTLAQMVDNGIIEYRRGIGRIIDINAIKDILE